MPSSKTIVYITNTRFPTEKAHGLATVKICEAFADIGWKVEVVAPRMWRATRDNIFQYYGIRSNFRIRKIPTIDFFSLGAWKKPAFLAQIFSFSIFAALYALLKYRRNEVIFFSHDYIPLYFVSFFARNIFYDIHHFPGKNFMYRRVIKRSFGFATQTKWKIGALEKEFSIPTEKIVYWPNGVEIEKFKIRAQKTAVRKKLNLPPDKKIAVYAGQLFGWKGVDTLVKASGFVGGNAAIFVVGGSPSDITRLISTITFPTSKVVFVGQRPHDEIPLWLKAADVLVLPNTGKQTVSRYYTSPMKLFEYMASGTPIVASAIPSIQEIAGEKNAVLAEADNPKDFAKKINWVFENPDEARALSVRAERDVEQYTWERRARKISKLFDGAI